ncbi:MAG: CoB--CoM heterodisulfide reductase iron-sulfur subunit A family protein, partial [Candidatus Kapaibacteriales bacterium]
MEQTGNLGVYICSGCEIGKSIDCQKLTDLVISEEKPTVCRTNNWLCNNLSLSQIKKDIEELKLDKIVISACSPRFLNDIFQFDENIICERVNLREQVAWTHTPNDEHTFDLALDYIKMGIAKAKNSQYPTPLILETNSTILVVGGGVAGLNSSLASAESGYNVILCEKESELGGFYRNIYKLVPHHPPYLSPEVNNIEELVAKVLTHPKIEVLTNCVIKQISGQPGMFNVTANVNGKEIQFQVGAIVQATGWRPYDANKLSHLGYGKEANIVTNIEFEKLIKNNKIFEKFNGSKPENFVFIQCAGSRDPNHLPYCSSFCCSTSLKQALYVREFFPQAKIYIIYK